MFRFLLRARPADPAPSEAGEVRDFLGLPGVKRRTAEKMREESDAGRRARGGERDA